MIEIKSEDYHITYDPAKATVTCQGSLRLSGMEEYAPIVRLLNDVVDSQPEKIILDLRELEFLNSSGINMMSKFAITIRQKGNIQLIVISSLAIPWQGKSLKNLQRLLPSLQLEFQ